MQPLHFENSSSYRLQKLIAAAFRTVGLLVVLAGATVGCERVEPLPPALPTPLPPLTVEEWKGLPIEEKYDDATFERLRDADKKLRTDRGWQKFMVDVVIPERKIDIPGVPGVPEQSLGS